jgi:hypothetical protein
MGRPRTQSRRRPDFAMSHNVNVWTRARMRADYFDAGSRKPSACVQMPLYLNPKLLSSLRSTSTQPQCSGPSGFQAPAYSMCPWIKSPGSRASVKCRSACLQLFPSPHSLRTLNRVEQSIDVRAASKSVKEQKTLTCKSARSLQGA